MESKKDEDAAEKSMAAESEMLSLKGGNLDGTASTVLGGGGSLGLGQTASQGEALDVRQVRSCAVRKGFGSCHAR